MWYDDDVICITADPGKYISRIQEDFKIKDDNISESEMYLGETSSKILLEIGKTFCTMLA